MQNNTPGNYQVLHQVLKNKKQDSETKKKPHSRQNNIIIQQLFSNISYF